MTLEEFIEKYDGKGIDFDYAYGFQCVDLFRQYCQDVLNIPQSPPTGSKGAVTIADTYLSEYLDKIENTTTGVPKRGDIVIWGTKYGPYGHVAVFLDGDVNSFNCFSQNDPINTLSHIQHYKNYYGVICWLRPKKGNMTELKTCLADRQKFWDERDSLYRALGVDNQDKALSEISRLKKAEIRVLDLENEAERLRMDVKHLEEKIEDHVCESSLLIEETLKVGDTTLILNGMTVDSDGKAVGNYEVKK